MSNCGNIKSKIVGKMFFFIYVQMGSIEEPFIWMFMSCAISSTTNGQKRTEIARMTTVKKLISESGTFENTVKFNWQPMELFKNRRCP